MSEPQAGYLGLAPFLRASLGEGDLPALARQWLDRAGREDTAAAWMNLATALLCLGQTQTALAAQREALSRARTYALPGPDGPAPRLLLLALPGPLSANTPLDCLLEGQGLQLVVHFVDPAVPLAEALPEHDALMLVMGVSEAALPVLAALQERLAAWPRPVLNPPAAIRRTERATLSRLLADAPGVLMPPTRRVPRALLESAAAAGAWPEGLEAPPFLLRPPDSQGGHGLARIGTAAELAAYLAAQPEGEFFLTRYVNYAGPDGRFRKIRVALVGGQAFPVHLAVSEHWMVHYVNAGMYGDAAKRAEEAAFFRAFPEFAQRHAPALSALSERLGLDYVCVDLAETADGRLLIFEADPAMVAHAMEPGAEFAYRREGIAPLREAFVGWVRARRSGGG